MAAERLARRAAIVARSQSNLSASAVNLQHQSSSQARLAVTPDVSAAPEARRGVRRDRRLSDASQYSSSETIKTIQQQRRGSEIGDEVSLLRSKIRSMAHSFALRDTSSDFAKRNLPIG